MRSLGSTMERSVSRSSASTTAVPLLAVCVGPWEASRTKEREFIPTMLKRCLLVTLIALSVTGQAEPKKEDKPPATDPVFVGAGDIASCDDLSGAYATAKLIEKIPGT